MALGIVSAVLGAQRTGLGCDVDVCLFDTALHQLSYPATWYLNQGHITGRLPRGSHPSITPSQLVKTKDGWGLLMCQTPKFWTIWCQQTGCDLATDERFVDIPSRRANLPASPLNSLSLPSMFNGLPTTKRSGRHSATRFSSSRQSGLPSLALRMGSGRVVPSKVRALTRRDAAPAALSCPPRASRHSATSPGQRAARRPGSAPAAHRHSARPNTPRAHKNR